MPRKSLDKCFTDNPIFWERSSCSFPYFRLGQVWAEPTKRVKGLVPCRFLGQRPKPSERKPRSFRAYIFFSIFFITYFTLPWNNRPRHISAAYAFRKHAYIIPNHVFVFKQNNAFCFTFFPKNSKYFPRRFLLLGLSYGGKQKYRYNAYCFLSAADSRIYLKEEEK